MPDSFCQVPDNRPPRKHAGLSGVDLYVAGACPAKPNELRFFLVFETQKGRACDIAIASLGRLLEPIGRRQLQAAVDRPDGDAYDKSFKSRDHLVALIFGR